MKLLARRTLREFYEQPGRGDAMQPLLAWAKAVEKADWNKGRVIMACVIRPIHTEEEYEEAMRVIEELWDNPDDEAQSQLEVLTILAEAYEKEHHALPDPDPIEALRFHMEQRGLTNKDLLPCIGTRSRISEILHKRRALTLNMIRALHYMLGIPAEALLGTVELNRPARHQRKPRKRHIVPK